MKTFFNRIFARNTDPVTSHDAMDNQTASKVEAMIIQELGNHGKVTASDIAFKCGLDRDTVTPALNRLHKRSMVKKLEEKAVPKYNGKTRQQQLWTI